MHCKGVFTNRYFVTNIIKDFTQLCTKINGNN